MRATLMYGAGDVRVQDAPDPAVQEPTDAVVRVLRAAVCGSDLWPYRSMPPATQSSGVPSRKANCAVPSPMRSIPHPAISICCFLAARHAN
jgi:threonine dehydrogenase-like Zn-dependent dehydrogenase